MKPMSSIDRAQLINDVVCEYFGIKHNRVWSSGRKRDVVITRQLVWYLCRKYTSLSLKDMGRLFGNYDHTTVVHGTKTIAGLIEFDLELRSHVETCDRWVYSKLNTTDELKSLIDQAASRSAAMHFNAKYNPDQNWACQCCFRDGVDYAMRNYRALIGEYSNVLIEPNKQTA